MTDNPDHRHTHATLTHPVPTMITLYDCATAPSPRRARILLAEKGVAHDTVNINLGRGEIGRAHV